MSDMPCGLCPVCDEPVDHSEAGFCDHCGGAFHWTACGGWKGGKHTCTDCDDEEIKNDSA